MRIFTQIFSTTYAPAGNNFGTGASVATTKPYKAGNSIVAPNGKFYVLSVDLPEGSVTHLAVIQTGGTNKAFTVDLLDSLTPWVTTGALLNATVAASSVELYKVIDTMSGTAGNVASFRDPRGYPYNNVDGDYTTQSRKLYIVIKPTASVDDTTWDVVITVWSDIK